MISLFRIFALFKRYVLLIFKGNSSILNIIYWPVLNIVLWGTTSIWLQNQAPGSNMIILILSGLILWQIVFRVNIETAKSLLEELYTNNLINLFSTPLNINEWLAAILMVGLVQTFLVFIASGIAAYLLYGVNIMQIGFILMPFALSLLISGLAIGVFICGLLIKWGKKVQDFIYSIGWAFGPFSAIYYPLASLPVWVQKIALFLPMSYVFESMRAVINGKTIPSNYIAISFGLNIIYLTSAIIFFKTMFEQSKSAGLANLD